jgi:hypothetical protein
LKLAKILSGIAAILLVGSSLNAETVTFTQTQTVGLNYADFYLGKFNTGLGTLTGVSVNVVYSTLTGSILVTNKIAGNATVSKFWSDVIVRQAGVDGIGTLGYDINYSPTLRGVATTPSWVTTVIPGNTSQTFTINGGQNVLTNDNVIIAAGYWAAYSSLGGVGNVNFQALNSQTVSTTGGVYEMDSTLAGASTQLQIVYTYDAGPVPVPEASTVIVQLLIVAGGVWMFVRRRRAAAARA